MKDKREALERERDFWILRSWKEGTREKRKGGEGGEAKIQAKNNII